MCDKIHLVEGSPFYPFLGWLFMVRTIIPSIYLFLNFLPIYFMIIVIIITIIGLSNKV